MMYILPYNILSESARLLQKTIRERGVPCLRSRKRGIPWGIPDNDKLSQLLALSRAGVSCVPFTDDISQARAWIEGGSKVVCRSLLRASGGRGLVIAKTQEELIKAPLYTKYIKKIAEYRVHVCFDNVLLVQKKLRKRNWSGERNPYIRNHDEGYVFSVNFVKPVPPSIPELAQLAVAALDLSLGAVDIIWNEKKQQAYVLEVNTAPGLTPSTAVRYAQAIISARY